MPRNFNKYQYETSPRKIEPEYTPIREKKIIKKSTAKKATQKNSKSKIKKKKNVKLVAVVYLVSIFTVLFSLCYRNAKIDEEFSKLQDIKSDLSVLEKETAQLEINIENDLNLNNLEQSAKDLLGMQKLTSKQTVYVELPKTDYIESASEKVLIEKEKENFFERIINHITNIFN